MHTELVTVIGRGTERRHHAFAHRRHDQPEPTPRSLALAAATRLQRSSAIYEHESKLVLARQLEILIEQILAAAETGSAGSLERYLDNVVAASTVRGVSGTDFLVASAETRRAITRLSKRRGSTVELHAYWRVLRHAEEYFLGRIAGCLEATLTDGHPPAIGLFDFLPKALLVLDERGRVQYANAKVRSVLGIRPRALIGKHVVELLKPRPLSRMAQPDSYATATLRILTSPSETHEDVFRLDDGSVYVRRSLPIVEQDRLCQLIVITEITPARPPADEATVTELADEQQRQARDLEPATAA